jgi:peroxiredoxin Q/BCP
VVLGISKDTVEKQAKFKAKYDLPFTLLSDVDQKVCAAYDVIKEKSMYGRKVMGIERSTFVIGPDGKVEHIYRKVKVDGHVADILAVL